MLNLLTNFYTAKDSIQDMGQQISGPNSSNG